VGHERYFAKAEEQVEGPIRAACLVMGPHVWRRGPYSGGPWSVLVVTTDELRVFSLRPAGWRHPNTSLIDTELMRVPLSAVERLDRRLSAKPWERGFRLTFTDGRRMALGAMRGVGCHSADVIDCLAELIAGGRAPGERRPS
jgi:hypothetical protein